MGPSTFEKPKNYIEFTKNHKVTVLEIPNSDEIFDLDLRFKVMSNNNIFRSCFNTLTGGR